MTETRPEQCPNPDLHPPHDSCAGLDGTEHERGHRLSVTCPSCAAPAGVPCEHADRAEAARISDVEWGTCALCHQPLARLTDPLDVVHPDPDDAEACPPMPDPQTDWNAHAAAVNAGLSHGHPGVEHFIPAKDFIDTEPGGIVVPGPLCPECAQGKVLNCAQEVLIYGGEGVQPDRMVACANARGDRG